ncbi:MAG: hypothetical protein Q8882_07625, partial [Bacillota bacterium]|nr:hypothetical protein [Bacillota bacterium]
MSLQLIYGRTGSGKSELINKSLLQTKGLLIVPETYTFISEKQVAKLCGALGFSDIEVLSFLRLFHKLSDRGPLGEPSVDPAGKIMALSMITEQLHDELTLLKHSCEKAGFAESMLSFISELKRYSVSPESLLEASKNVASPLLSSKLSDISKIYSAYTAFLETGYTDRDDDLDRLYSLLLSKRPLEGKYIYIDRFVNFTVAEYKIIDAMLNQCEKVTVALPCEVGSLEMQFFTSQRAAERLTELAVTSGVEVNTPIMRRPISQGEKAHLEQNFFAFEPDKWAEETKNISVFIAKNRYTEIENAAREICRLVREEGYRYYDISVISRDWQNYDMQIKSVFRKFKIPYTDTSKESAGSHPVSLFILAALESVISGFTYEPVFKYLKCGFADITEEDIDRLENYVLATGIKGDAFIKEEKWNYRSSLFFGRDITSKELEELNALDISRRIVIAPLLKLKEGIKGKRTAKEFCTALYAFIKDTQLDEKIQHRSEQLLLE